MAPAPDPSAKPGRSLARYLVIATAAILYIAAGVVYLSLPSELLWAVRLLAAIATVYVFIYLFGSEKTCEKSLFYIAWIL